MGYVSRTLTIAIVVLAVSSNCEAKWQGGLRHRFPQKTVANSTCRGDMHSSSNICGGHNVEASCWCDRHCEILNDCCDDHADTCTHRRMVVPKERQVVTRREIRTMPQSEQRRFAANFVTIMVNRGDDTSFFHDMAIIHRDLCSHGTEDFPAWHRAYTMVMEHELQQADIANGNDGVFAIPYWNWLDKELEEREVFPSIITEHFDSIPAYMGVTIARRSLEQMRDRLNGIGGFPGFPGGGGNATLQEQVDASLIAPQHWEHASRENNGFMRTGESMELPHDGVHTIVGRPMQMKSAAWDPTFYLHHSMCDLIYESYLVTHPDSQAQFEEHQRLLVEQDSKNKNLYTSNIIPFTHPGTDKLVYPADLFDTEALGYRYDTLFTPTSNANQPDRAVETLAAFMGINITDLGTTYQLHVFVVHKDAVHDLSLPKDERAFRELNEYAGIGTVFGRAEIRPDFNVFVPIDDALNRQGLKRSDAAIVTLCDDMDYEGRPLVPIEETRMPMPVIIGPGFNNLEDDMSLENGNGDEFEIINIQSYLTRYGYLKVDSVTSGVFDVATRDAIMRFQTQYGIIADGVVDSATKSAMLQPRDYNVEMASGVAMRAGSSNDRVKYYLDHSPAGLDRHLVEAEVRNAFAFWEDLVALRFVPAVTIADADVVVHWTTKWVDSRKDVFPLDGQGLTLSRGIPSEGVDLDAGEVWKLLSQQHVSPAGDDEYYIEPVLVHSIGHMLGLGHVDGAGSVMSPFYSPYVPSFSESDFAELYNVIGDEWELRKMRPQFFA